jgi:hypothetical protein
MWYTMPDTFVWYPASFRDGLSAPAALLEFISDHILESHVAFTKF